MFLFVPDDQFNAIVMKWLRRAVAIYGIELYAVVIMCNHFHLVLRAPNMNLSEFMRYFSTNLSREVNKLRGRKGELVFYKRFSSEPILDYESLERMLSYVMANPVSANMVSQPGEHPGYTSWHQAVGDSIPVRHTEEPPAITPPPHWAHLSEEDRRAEWNRLLIPRIEKLNKERTGRVMGARRVRKLNWRMKPNQRQKQRRPQPLCHAVHESQTELYKAFLNQQTTMYRTSIARWREGEEVEFPFGTYPPGWSQCDRRMRRRCPPHLRIGPAREPIPTYRPAA